MGTNNSTNMCKDTQTPMECDAENSTSTMEQAAEKAVNISDLSFKYPNEYYDNPYVIHNATLQLERGTRCLLLGANGAGKTTLLNIAGGKHMHALPAVQVLGQPSFHNTHPGITLLTGNWSRAVSFAGTNVAYQADVTVRRMLETHGDYDKARLAKLLEVLDVNLSWRMHMVSDGQRRRVQILMGLLKPFEVLLLDEVTVDLDVVSRSDLLAYLKEETESRGATILYATHIFDGLDHWATHLAHIQTGGVVRKLGRLDEFEELNEQFAKGCTAPLMRVVEGWLRAERKSAITKRAQDQVQELEDEGFEAAEAKVIKRYCDDPFNKFGSSGAKDQYNYW